MPLLRRPLEAANEWLERYRRLWEVNFDRLEELLVTMQAEPKAKAKRGAKR